MKVVYTRGESKLFGEASSSSRLLEAATASAVNTLDATVANTLNEEEIKQLPFLARNPTTALTLQPAPDSPRAGRMVSGAEEFTQAEMKQTAPAGGTQTLHVAVVHSAGEVRLVTAAVSRSALDEALAEHVHKSARHQLWPEDARRVRRLLSNKQFASAVELYFASVGGRWDEERLFIEAISV